MGNFKFLGCFLPRKINFLKRNFSVSRKNKTDFILKFFPKFFRKSSRITKLSSGQTFWFFIGNLVNTIVFAKIIYNFRAFVLHG